MQIPVYIMQPLLLLHLIGQFWIVFYVDHITGSHGVMKFLTMAIMAGLWYTSYFRYTKDRVSLQKRLINYAFLTWSLRSYVDLFTPGLADIMSLAVVWMFVRSQTHVLNVQQKTQRILDVSFITFEILLFISGLGGRVQPGIIPNMTHTLIFTSSHVLYIAVIFILYARAVILSKDPTIQVRFVFLMTAAVLYVGLFLSDFIWRSLVPAATSNLPIEFKRLFEIAGMLSLYGAFNMGDKARSFILSWYRIYTGQAQKRLISLVLYISEAVAMEEDHILPTLALRLAERLSVTPEQRRIVREAAAVLAIIRRHDLPDMRQQWQDPKPIDSKPDTNIKLKNKLSPFEERLDELERVNAVLDALPATYNINKENGLLEVEILRVVVAYLTNTPIQDLLAGRGRDYSPRVVDALFEEVNEVDKTAVKNMVN